MSRAGQRPPRGARLRWRRQGTAEIRLSREPGHHHVYPRHSRSPSAGPGENRGHLVVAARRVPKPEAQHSLCVGSFELNLAASEVVVGLRADLERAVPVVGLDDSDDSKECGSVAMAGETPTAAVKRHDRPDQAAEPRTPRTPTRPVGGTNYTVPRRRVATATLERAMALAYGGPTVESVATGNTARPPR